MSLTDRLSNTPAKIHGKPCSIGALVSKLGNDAEGVALQAMLYELGWSQRRIYEALEAEGHMVGEQSINRHRSRACRCYKVAQ
jgi:hypothetical protein